MLCVVLAMYCLKLVAHVWTLLSKRLVTKFAVPLHFLLLNRFSSIEPITFGVKYKRINIYKHNNFRNQKKMDNVPQQERSPCQTSTIADHMSYGIDVSTFNILLTNT